MKGRLQRIYTLDRWLRQGRRIVAKEVAVELGVDEKTIRRDLTEVLRDEWRLPLQYDRGERVWYYAGEAAHRCRRPSSVRPIGWQCSSRSSRPSSSAARPFMTISRPCTNACWRPSHRKRGQATPVWHHVSDSKARPSRRCRRVFGTRCSTRLTTRRRSASNTTPPTAAKSAAATGSSSATTITATRYERSSCRACATSKTPTGRFFPGRVLI